MQNWIQNFRTTCVLDGRTSIIKISHVYLKKILCSEYWIIYPQDILYFQTISTSCLMRGIERHFWFKKKYFFNIFVLFFCFFILFYFFNRSLKMKGLKAQKLFGFSCLCFLFLFVCQRGKMSGNKSGLEVRCIYIRLLPVV